MVRPRSKARRESALESRAVKWARTRGIIVAKLTECAGVPDRIFFLPKKPLIIEFKKHGEEPETLQNWYLGTLLDVGYTVGWCDEWKGFLEIMKKRGVQ
jgi:hypothetical protein